MTDAISRQSVIDMLDETKRIARQNIDGAVLMTFERVLDSLVNNTNALPTIQPKRIKGQWSIKGQAIDTVRGYWAKCSACGHSVFGGGNYCSYCGSYNKGEVIT